MEDISISINISLEDAIRKLWKQSNHHSYIETNSGRIIDFLDIDSGQICLEDIAVALSNITRFVGQLPRFYSVAEHCILVSKFLEADAPPVPGVVESGFMHDSAEAYIGDVTTPLKKLCPAYRMIEEDMERAIINRFGLGIPFSNPMIKAADQKMFQLEYEFFHHHRRGTPSGLISDRFPIQCMSPNEARIAFLERAEELKIREVSPSRGLGARGR